MYPRGKSIQVLIPARQFLNHIPIGLHDDFGSADSSGPRWVRASPPDNRRRALRLRPPPDCTDVLRHSTCPAATLQDYPCPSLRRRGARILSCQSRLLIGVGCQRHRRFVDAMLSWQSTGEKHEEDPAHRTTQLFHHLRGGQKK